MEPGVAGLGMAPGESENGGGKGWNQAKDGGRRTKVGKGWSQVSVKRAMQTIDLAPSTHNLTHTYSCAQTHSRTPHTRARPYAHAHREVTARARCAGTCTTLQDLCATRAQW